jgi:hypothetical protein
MRTSRIGQLIRSITGDYYCRPHIISIHRGCTLIETVPPTPSRSSLDDVIDAYKPGIDVTLIEENLRRSVDDRLQCLQRLLEFAEELRRAGRELATKK